MNKAKLLELADEVLTNIDVDMQSALRKELEINLCSKLSDIFYEAKLHEFSAYKTKKNQKSYKAVKPILDDCIDKLLTRRANS